MPDPATMGQILGLIKLAQYTASGIGVDPVRVLFPTWIAKREGEAKLVDAETSAQAIAIEAEAQSKAMKTIAEAQIEAQKSLQPAGLNIETDVDFSERVEQSVRFRAAKRQANVETIVRTAAAELGDKTVPDDEPDHDWTARLFEYGQDVSAEEMQMLWAKVLAGEVERPGSTSLHTLSVLRDLDRETAKLFANLCSLSLFYFINETTLDDARVVSFGKNAADNALSDYGLPYGALTRLNEHGLITSDFNSWKAYGTFLWAIDQIQRIGGPVQNIGVLEKAMALQYANESWYLRRTADGDSDPQIRIHGVAMSVAGKELSRVVSGSANLEYSVALAAFLRSRNLQLVRYSDGSDLEARLGSSN